jgi:cytochrome c-type biogenesis protein CcmE
LARPDRHRRAHQDSLKAILPALDTLEKAQRACTKERDTLAGKLAGPTTEWFITRIPYKGTMHKYRADVESKVEGKTPTDVWDLLIINAGFGLWKKSSYIIIEILVDCSLRAGCAGTRSGRLVLVMTRRKRRLVLISSALAVLGLAVGLVLVALRDNIVFFYGPSELAQKAPRAGQRLRIGGLVKQGSLVHEGGRTVRFAVTDTKQEVEVTYTGLLPDLFREGQGVVAEGTLGQDNILLADSILAKHDERYMPRDVADALKKQGVWREGAEAASMGK